MVRAWSVTDRPRQIVARTMLQDSTEWGCAASLLVLSLIVVVAAIAVGVLLR